MEKTRLVGPYDLAGDVRIYDDTVSHQVPQNWGMFG